MSIIHNDLTINNIENSYYKKYSPNLPYTFYLTTYSICQQIVSFKTIFSFSKQFKTTFVYNFL